MKQNYWKARNIYEYYPSDATHIYSSCKKLHDTQKIDSLSVNKDHIYCRTERELLKLIENTMKKFAVKALVEVSWGYVGERILRNISSLVKTDNNLLIIEL